MNAEDYLKEISFDASKFYDSAYRVFVNEFEKSTGKSHKHYVSLEDAFEAVRMAREETKNDFYLKDEVFMDIIEEERKKEHNEAIQEIRKWLEEFKEIARFTPLGWSELLKDFDERFLKGEK